MKTLARQWLLKIFVVLEIAFLLAVAILYLLSNAKTVEFALDKITQSYPISYDDISGSLLETMTLKNLTYEGSILAQEAEIDFNIKALLTGNIAIEKLSLKQVNIRKIQNLLQQSKDNNQSSKPKAEKSLPPIEIAHLFISTLPYQNDFITLKKARLDVYDVSSDLKTLDIKSFAFFAATNLGILQTQGNLENQKLHLLDLALKQIDIPEIQHLIEILPTSTDANNTPPAFLHHIQADTLSLTLKPFTHEDINVDTLTINAQEVDFSLLSQETNAQAIMINAQSNLATLSLEGRLTHNQFLGHSTINLMQSYFQKFTKIINFQNFNPIQAKLNLTPAQLSAEVTLKSKQVFAGRYKDYFTAIHALRSTLNFNIEKQTLQALTDANVSSKYAHGLQLHDTLMMDNNLSYQGTIAIDDLKDFPRYSLPLFTHAVIDYKGDSKDLVANLNTDKLHLLYSMYDFNRADFLLHSKPLEIVSYFPQIPTFLHPLLATLEAKMSLDFDSDAPLQIETKIDSNAINIQGTTTINHGVTSLDTQTTLSENSLLKTLDPHIKFSHIFPAAMTLTYHDSDLNISLDANNKHIKERFAFDTNTSYLDNTLHIDDETITIKGPLHALNLTFKTTSLKSLQKKVHPFYDFEPLPIDGEINVDAKIQDLSSIDATLHSRWIVYEYALNRFAFAEKLSVHLYADSENATLTDYQFHTFLDQDRRFFATKPSHFTYNQERINIVDLWVNDALLTTGVYHPKTADGRFHSHAKRYHYVGKEGDIVFNTNIHTILKKNQTHLEGNLDILEGTITYQYQNTHEIHDPDIIIVQEEQERLLRQAQKKTDLSLDISITAKQPLSYKGENVKVTLTPDIKLWKESQKPFELLGRAIILKGLYTQSDKEFEILKSEVLFAGDMLNPLLNIKATHTNDPYQITIDIAGSLDSPIINFSSSPYLSQSDILSMLLFSATTDSLFEGSANASNQALSMLGNTFAKEIVKNFGLSLDRLVLSTNEKGGLGIEIGKKISNKVTVIYTNDIVQSIKVRYQHSRRFETDLMLSPESSGIDFIFKSEH